MRERFGGKPGGGHLAVVRSWPIHRVPPWLPKLRAFTGGAKRGPNLRVRIEKDGQGIGIGKVEIVDVE